MYSICIPLQDWRKFHNHAKTKATFHTLNCNLRSRVFNMFQSSCKFRQCILLFSPRSISHVFVMRFNTAVTSLYNSLENTMRRNKSRFYATLKVNVKVYSFFYWALCNLFFQWPWTDIPWQVINPWLSHGQVIWKLQTHHFDNGNWNVGGLTAYTWEKWGPVIFVFHSGFEQNIHTVA